MAIEFGTDKSLYKAASDYDIADVQLTIIDASKRPIELSMHIVTVGFDIAEWHELAAEVRQRLTDKIRVMVQERLR